MPNQPKQSYYAVAKGRTQGIYMSWPDAEAQVKGYSGAEHKKFDNVVSANDFISSSSSGSSSSNAPSNPPK